jgi:hypothetical protein
MLLFRSFRLYLSFATLLTLTAAPAAAQFVPQTLNDPATGEKYHIEASAGFWFPSADMKVSGESLGIPGSIIDMKNDLGLTDQGLGELHLVLRPTRKFKVRFQYIPLKYEQVTQLPRPIVFNAQLYPAGAEVASSVDWKAYRIGIEIDFVSRDRGFAGLLIEDKHTSVDTTLSSASTVESYHALFPVPAIGGIGRVYVTPNISITGELSGIKLPELVQDVRGHFVDFDIYGTINFTNNIGAKFGYRAMDLEFLVDGSAAHLKPQGLYFGVVARY